jgi:uncharacterized protein GlcG (DUF336 family)
MLKEKTVFWSSANACSNPWSSPRCKSATACSISERIWLNVTLLSRGGIPLIASGVISGAIGYSGGTDSQEEVVGKVCAAVIA